MRLKNNEDFIVYILCAIIVLFILLYFYLGFQAGSQRRVDILEQRHAALVSEILFLESTHGKNLHGKHGEYGPAQFKRSSFDWMKGKAKMGWLEWKDHHDQVTLLDWAIRNGYKKHWTTYDKAEMNVVMKKYI